MLELSEPCCQLTNQIINNNNWIFECIYPVYMYMLDSKANSKPCGPPRKLKSCLFDFMLEVEMLRNELRCESFIPPTVAKFHKSVRHIKDR